MDDVRTCSLERALSHPTLLPPSLLPPSHPPSISHFGFLRSGGSIQLYLRHHQLLVHGRDGHACPARRLCSGRLRYSILSSQWSCHTLLLQKEGSSFAFFNRFSLHAPPLHLVYHTSVHITTALFFQPTVRKEARRNLLPSPLAYNILHISPLTTDAMHDKHCLV